jgi:hypothetical protein
MQVTTTLLLLATSSLAAAAQPGGLRGGGVKRPPCFSPFNPSFESLCFEQVALGPRGTNVSVHSYGAEGAVITALSAVQNGPLTYLEALEVGLPQLFPYFVPGLNSKFQPVNRTVPIMATHTGSPSEPFAESWTVAMGLPTSVYPTSATAPTPDDFFTTFVTPFVANPLVAVRHFVTPALPVDADWATNSAFLSAHIPAGYTAVPGAPYTFAIYDVRDATNLRNNEVWLPVTAA